MEISVRLSLGLAKSAGSARWLVDLPEGATVADLLDRLCAEHPDLAQQLSATVTVISGQTVDRSTPLSSGQEIAFLTPISGGGF